MSIAKHPLVRDRDRAAATSLSMALAVLLAFSASAVVPGIDWSVHAEARTVVVPHSDEDGTRRETTVWLGVSQGRGYVRGGGGRWVGNTRRDGGAVLRIGDVDLSVRATPIEDEAEPPPREGRPSRVFCLLAADHVSGPIDGIRPVDRPGRGA